MEVGEVEDGVERRGVVVIDDSFPVELVILPVSLVGYAAVGVVENAESVHFVVLPLSIVVAALLVVELASAIAFAASLIALILGAYLVLFDNELAFFVGVVVLSYFSNRGVIIVSLGRSGRLLLCISHLETCDGLSEYELGVIFNGRPHLLMVN